MYEKTDMAIDSDGDLIITSITDENGIVYKDLGLASNMSELEQFTATRLKTKLGEFLLHPDIGNRLEDIIGKRNTEETAEEGKQYILSAITNQSYIDPADVNITPVPISLYKIAYIIEIDSLPYAGINMTLEIDLQNGTRRIIQ
jgi:hypothetical protein